MKGSFGAAHGVIADIVSISERGSYTGTLILLSVRSATETSQVSGNSERSSCLDLTLCWQHERGTKLWSSHKWSDHARGKLAVDLLVLDHTVR